MKPVFLHALLFFYISMYAQPDTEVYLVDMNTSNGKIQLSNPRNISNNQGYDNQPSFFDKNEIIFASTRQGQTDILKFNVFLCISVSLRYVFYMAE